MTKQTSVSRETNSVSHSETTHNLTKPFQQNKMNNPILVKNLRCIPDWPIKGINFRDVTTLFKSAECVKIMADEMYELYKDKGITKIVGIESRGFVMSSALATRPEPELYFAENQENYQQKP